MSRRSFPPKDFQLATIERVFNGLFGTEGNASGRMLVADEVGLGKTIVAKEVIQRALIEKPDLSVVYICNNAQIASQNLRKLDVSEDGDAAVAADRLTLIGASPARSEGGLRLLSLTPGTSFNLRSQGGMMKERAFLYRLLQRHPDLMAERRLSGLLSLGCNAENWAWWVGQMKDVQPAILATFHERLSADGLVARIRERCAYRIGEPTTEDRQLIGKLRQILAEASLGSLAPDLIILDEFQRFRQLLEETTEDDGLESLARSLFNNNKVRMLLLSATPFRMLTLRGEDQAGEDHYSDFHFLIRFLLGDRPEKQAAFRKDWDHYSLLMARGPATDLAALDLARTQVQGKLRSIVCRTERADLTLGLGDTLIRKPVPLVPATNDLAAYVAGERLAERYRKKSHRLYDLINFYKSAPYPFSYLTDYQFSKVWKEETGDKELEQERANPVHWVPLEKINAYETVTYPCAAFRSLLDHMFSGGTELLLWVPPAQPTYPLTGVFAGRRGFTKTLLFSNYRMVPRSIATLMSYEAERRVIRPLLERGAYGREVTYTNLSVEDEEKTGRYASRLTNNESSKTNLTLLYPCLSLATYSLPDVATSAEALEVIAEEISQQAQLYGLNQDGHLETDADVNWYWQLPILLDRFSHDAELLYELYENSDIVPRQFRSEVLRLLREPVEGILAALGTRPSDLETVVALQALGSPATVGLRIMLAGTEEPSFSKDLCILLGGAEMIASTFRRYFNRPDPTAIIELSEERPKIPYWRSVLSYCRDGDLVGMLREYRYVTVSMSGYREATKEEQDKLFIDALEKVLTLQTASFTVKSYDSEMRLRTNFAAVFANEKSEDGSRQREERLRASFNSPFRPFVLASTSVGQEGLDFHPYAHHLWHWNLPANAVDLEQREGRINRFQHHAIRLNLAERYGAAVRRSADPWEEIFSAAREDSPAGASDVVPDWHVGQGVQGCVHQLKSFVPTLPYSKDEQRLRELERTLPLYRLALRQPDQEGLVALFGAGEESEPLVAFRDVGVLRLGG
jgi:hypothetical protein